MQIVSPNILDSKAQVGQQGQVDLVMELRDFCLNMPVRAYILRRAAMRLCELVEPMLIHIVGDAEVEYVDGAA